MCSESIEWQMAHAERQHQNFNPYEDNGGTIVAIAGPNFAIIGADSRLSSGYIIHTRDQTKLFKLSEKTVLASSGCWPDSLAFIRLVMARISHYKSLHNKEMSTEAVAQMISILMYERRFFPYYVSNILAGVDSEGKGCVYSYDPIGHCERAVCRAGGSSGSLLQPLLDNQVLYKNQENVDKVDLTIKQAEELIKDTFMSAAERDIKTGDRVDIRIITPVDDVMPSEHYLRRD